jgi:hypothetical protein
MNAPTPSTILDSLPFDIREGFEAVGRTGRGPLGRLQTQQIVDNNMALIRRLRAIGGTHADLAAVLSSVGITSKTGSALTATTLSAAISRAKTKTPKRRTAPKRAASSAAPVRPVPGVLPAIQDSSVGVGDGLRLDTARHRPFWVGGAGGSEQVATRSEVISPERPGHEIDRDHDPRAAIFDLLDDSKEN